MSLTTTINLVLDILHTKSLDLSAPVDRLSKTYAFSLTDGTGSGKGDLLFHDKRTLADGASEDLDLAGALSDAFGDTLTFVKIKALIIKNLSATQTLTIGNATSNAFVGPFGAATHTLKVQAGAQAVLVMDPVGYSVTAGTGDLLKIANSAGASCDYEIVIVGASA